MRSEGLAEGSMSSSSDDDTLSVLSVMRGLDASSSSDDDGARNACLVPAGAGGLTWPDGASQYSTKGGIRF